MTMQLLNFLMCELSQQHYLHRFQYLSLILLMR